MSLPYSQVMLSWVSAVLRTSPPPSAIDGLSILLGLPMFMRNPYYARHPILLRAAISVPIVVASRYVSGFALSGRLTTAKLRNEA